MPRRTKPPPEADLLAIAQWIELQRPIPPEMKRARNFYEAAHAAHKFKWEAPVHKVAAIHTWMTAALAKDQRTQIYLVQLVPGDDDGLSWVSKFSRATFAAMEQLASESTKSSPRRFERKHSAAIKSLQKASEALSEMHIELPLRDLLSHPMYQLFSEEVRDFEIAEWMRKSKERTKKLRRASEARVSSGQLALIGLIELARDPVNKVPTFRELLALAEQRIASSLTRVADRHEVRATFIREMFRGLQSTDIDNRIAFIMHAVKVLFSVDMNQRDLRKTVADLKREEDKLESILEEDEKNYIASLGGRPVPEDMRSLFHRRKR